jgi:dihydroorotase
MTTAATFDRVILGASVVTPRGIAAVDIGIAQGRIAALGDLSGAQAGERFEAKGLHALPGVIDSQVHFREPGLTHKEDIGTGSAGAAMGGVTTFFEMPNTKPNTDSALRLAEKVALANEKSWVDFAFYIGATKENADRLGELENLPGCAGVKIFLGSSTGTLLIDDPKVLERVLQSGTRRMACHSEDEARLKARFPLTEGRDVSFHPQWRDEETAMLSTHRLLEMAKRVGRKVHVLHVTSAGEIPLLAAAREIATFEVTPQHLTLAGPDCYERLGTLAQMNPPIREAHHRDALWKAVTAGLVDVLGSDHAPHTLEEKQQPYPKSPSGMPGVQTLLPLMLNHLAQGRLTLERLVDLTAHGPARIFGLQGKGGIVVDNDADLVLVDLKAERTITKEWMKTRCGWTPFDGMQVMGWPIATMLRGEWVMRDNGLLGAPRGNAVRFNV